MLASTVQFSTNDQPTTHSPPPNPKEHNRNLCRLISSGIGDQAMPGSTETTTRPLHKATPFSQGPPAPRAGLVVPSGPNRVHRFDAINQPHPTTLSIPTSPPPKGKRTNQVVLTIEDRCQTLTRPVSPPTSTPTPHPGVAGSWTGFPV
jgi:hypothetical protein